MTDKKYRLTENIEFSIDIERTVSIIQYSKRVRESFHMGVMIYYSDGTKGTTSIYIPLSDSIKKERRRMRMLRKRYKPTDEFIHMVRATLLILFRQWKYI